MYLYNKLYTYILQLFNALNQFNDYSDFLVALMIFYGHFIYMFMANSFGQSVIDHSAEMLDAT